MANSHSRTRREPNWEYKKRKKQDKKRAVALRRKRKEKFEKVYNFEVISSKEKKR